MVFDIVRKSFYNFQKLLGPNSLRLLKNLDVITKCLAEKSVPVRIPSIQPYTPEEHGINSSHPQYEIFLDNYRKLRDYTIWLEDQNRIYQRNERNFRYWHDIIVVQLLKGR